MFGPQEHHIPVSKMDLSLKELHLQRDDAGFALIIQKLGATETESTASDIQLYSFWGKYYTL